MSHIFLVASQIMWVVIEFINSTVKYWGTFCCALVLSLVLTPLCRKLAIRFGMVDQPGPRRINKTPIPRAGGLAVFLATNISLMGLVFVTGNAVCSTFSLTMMKQLTILASMLVLLGLADDKWNLNPFVKLFGQVAVAFTTFAWCGVGFHSIFHNIPVWLDAFVTVFWIVGAINAFNLIDGLDGLAAGLAVIAAVGMSGALFFLGVSTSMIPLIAFAGACLGFLRYNMNPASVFLGDTGSMFLGFFLGTIPLILHTTNSLFVSIGVPLLAMGVPIFDTFLAILRRVLRSLLKNSEHVTVEGQTHVMQADTDHLHHRILRFTLSQRLTTYALYLVAALLVVVGLAGVLLRNRATGLFIIAFIVVAVIIVREMERVELWDFGRLLANMDKARNPRHLGLRAALAVPALIVMDIISLVVVWACAHILLRDSITSQMLHVTMPIFVVSVFLAIVLSGAYRIVWSRASVSNFSLLFLAIFIGSLCALAAVILFEIPVSGRVAFTWVFASLSVFPLLGIRILHRLLNDASYATERCRLLLDPSADRLLVYGAGLRFRAFRDELIRGFGDNRRVILGIIDDDHRFRARTISGIRVHGTIEDAEAVIKRLKITTVVIACKQTEAARAHALEIFKRLGVNVTLWTCEETSLIKK